MNARIYARNMLQGYREDDGLVLQSAADEQLLLHIPFQQSARLSGIVIKSTKVPESAPHVVKMFVNRPTIGFAEAMESDPTWKIELTEEQLRGDNPITLPVVKFRVVNCLTIFIESNIGDTDVSIVEKIVIVGESVQGMDIGSIKDISKENS